MNAFNQLADTSELFYHYLYKKSDLIDIIWGY